MKLSLYEIETLGKQLLSLIPDPAKFIYSAKPGDWIACEGIAHYVVSGIPMGGFNVVNKFGVQVIKDTHFDILDAKGLQAYRIAEITTQLTPEEQESYARQTLAGEWIQAIKRLREQLNIGLKEAKGAVEAIAEAYFGAAKINVVYIEEPLPDTSPVICHDRLQVWVEKSEYDPERILIKWNVQNL